MKDESFRNLETEDPRRNWRNLKGIKEGTWIKLDDNFGKDLWSANELRRNDKKLLGTGLIRRIWKYWKNTWKNLYHSFLQIPSMFLFSSIPVHFYHPTCSLHDCSQLITNSFPVPFKCLHAVPSKITSKSIQIVFNSFCQMKLWWNCWKAVSSQFHVR